MPSRFESTFQERVIPAAERAFGVTVRFMRGVRVSAEFTARRNDRIYRAAGSEAGVELGDAMRDFILPLTSLVIDGDAIEPRTGDRISEGGETFEICPPDSNTPSVELRAGGFEWMVHTIRVK